MRLLVLRKLTEFLLRIRVLCVQPLIRHSIKTASWHDPALRGKEMKHIVTHSNTKPIMTLAFLLWCCCFMNPTHALGVKNITHGISRHMRSIGFPEGSNTGIFFALGIPIDIPDKSVSVSFYFEANYGLPHEWNTSYFHEKEDYFTKRSLSRRLVYEVFKSKMESLGYPGLDCLLRTICEAARFSLSENGLLGDILRIVFTPSMSKSENLSNEITEAEHEQHCNRRYRQCTVNPLDLVSHNVNVN